MVLLILGFAGNLGLETLLLVFGVFFTVSVVFLPTWLFISEMISLGELVSGFLEVLGLALVFTDVQRQLTQVRQANADMLRQGRMPDEEELRSWRARRPGSQDIQP
jgi:hypothetical protein